MINRSKKYLNICFIHIFIEFKQRQQARKKKKKKTEALIVYSMVDLEWIKKGRIVYALFDSECKSNKEG